MEKEKEKLTDSTVQGKAKEYKNKVVFLRKSKKGEHLYAFDYNGAFQSAIDGSIIINISEIEALLEDKFSNIKVSIMPKQEEKVK